MSLSYTRFCRPAIVMLLVVLGALAVLSSRHVAAAVSEPNYSHYTLSFQGYDFDGAGEETLIMNGALVAKIPPVLTLANSGTWASFSFNITNLVLQGANTVSFTHAAFDCAYTDQVRNFGITTQTIVVYTNTTVEDINTETNCTDTLSYTFTALGRFTLAFRGYDFDGPNEETLAVDGALVATIPPVLTPANGGTWVSFSFNITGFVAQGVNTISFTHANSDCLYIDQVRDLAVSNQTSTVYSNATVENINAANDCTNTLTYTFRIGASSPPPQLTGWGGVGLGENLTSIQTEMQTLVQRGYNTARVDFEPTCTTPPDSGILGRYDQTKLRQVVGLAKEHGLWIVVDYHGYTDLETNSAEQCWLGFWNSVVQNFTSMYSQIIWEPINEPQMTSSTDVEGLSSAYQALIDEIRARGDIHWIVVQNLCSSNCSFGDANMAKGYPTVTDPLGNLSQGGRIFISLHSYMGYKYYSSSWNNATAEKLAQEFYNAVLTGMKTTGWPSLNTEGGADPQVSSCSGPSDCVLPGAAGYAVTTFHFIQTLTNLYQANIPQRINWVGWPAGSWTDTPGAGDYGALQCNSYPLGWGCLLKTTPVTGQSTTLTTSFSYHPSSPQMGQAVSFAAAANGGAAAYDFSWNFGDGSTGAGSSIMHVYSSAGNFTVALTVSDSGSPQQVASSLELVPVANPPPTVGGLMAPVDRFALLATYVTLDSGILATVLAAIPIIKKVRSLRTRSRWK